MTTSTEQVEPQTALITVEKIDAPALFGEGKVEVMLDYIRAQVADTPTDISTVKNRTAIKSAAYKIARSKTILDDAGKKYVAELKLKVKGVDTHRKTLRDELDSLRDEIRKPVNDFEAAEEKRAGEIAERITAIIQAGQLSEGTSKALTEVLQSIKDTEITEADFGDKQGEAAIAKDIAISNLDRAIVVAEGRESDAEELKKLRKSEAEQAEKDKTRDAEDTARQEAADLAQASIDEAKARTEQAEKDAETALEAAEQAQKDADQRIADDAREREAKAEKERKEADARASNVEHRRTINRAAVAKLIEWSQLNEEQARDVITLIAAERIPAVTINY